MRILWRLEREGRACTVEAVEPGLCGVLRTLRHLGVWVPRAMHWRRDGGVWTSGGCTLRVIA